MSKASFAEIEYCTQHYLSENLDTLMAEVQRLVANKQAEELIDYGSSLGGVLSTMAGAANPGIDRSRQILQATGEWNSMQTEDYLRLCADKVHADSKMVHD